MFVDAFNPLRQLRQHLGRLDKHNDRQTTDPSPLSVPAADLYRDDANGAPAGSQVAMPSSVEEGAAVTPIIPPAEEADAMVDNDLDAVVLPSLGGDDDPGCADDDSPEPPQLADTAAHGHSHGTSSDRAEDPISSGNYETFSDPASAAENHDVPSVLDSSSSSSSSSKNDAKAHKEELLHRSLLQARFELEAHSQESKHNSRGCKH